MLPSVMEGRERSYADFYRPAVTEEPDLKLVDRPRGRLILRNLQKLLKIRRFAEMVPQPVEKIESALVKEARFDRLFLLEERLPEARPAL